MPATDLSGKQSTVALVIPGLCGPSLDASPGDVLTRRPAALERLLSRARHGAAALDTDATVYGFFEPGGASDSHLPVAPLTWLADTGQPPEPEYVMRADPVHVRADRSCLRLYDSATFDIDAAEAAALVSTFNDFYGVQGWRLVAPVPRRWYLFPPVEPEITTAAPSSIAGADLDGCLPAGRDASRWHAFLNEIQMLFHDHPVNAAREARGEVPVNSLWPWGGGVLPRRLTPRVVQVWSDQPLAKGFARLAGIPWQSQPEAAAGLLGRLVPGVNLVVLDALESCVRHAEIELWQDGIACLERDWFVHLQEQLEAGRLATLEIHPVNGRCFVINRHGLQRFWKRIRPLAWCCARG